MRVPPTRVSGAEPTKGFEMTDHQFMVELRIRAYIDQIDDYPLGHPKRENFKPLVPANYDSDDAPVNREMTLGNPCYHKFTAEDRELLLQRE